MKTVTFVKRLLATTFMLLLSQLSISQNQTIEFTTSSTITPPPGVTQFTVECWGAGGRGGTRTSNGVGGGGGGGAYARSVVTVTPGTAYTINVGLGSNSTTAGGDTWFGTTTTVLARGGNSCNDNSTTGATGGTAAASVGTIRFNGGNGANGGGTFGGGGGSSAGNGSNGGNGNLQNGGIAPFGGGAGGNGTTTGNTNGNAGLVPGGGGGGARRTSAGTYIGGAGANGKVVITYTEIVPTFTIYYENFDATDGGWTSSTVGGRNGSWIRTNTPLVGQGNYFITNPYNLFTRNTGIYLTSPVISTSGYQDINFSMDIRHDLDADSGDGVQVQYSLNGGAWTILNGTGGRYWYTSTSVAGLGSTAGWTGLNIENANSPSKFLEVSLPASVLNNAANVRFRIYFSDDNDTTRDAGVAVDNIVVRGNPIIPFTNPSFGPGSVNSDLKLWLKANATSYADGNAVTNWEDVAFDNDATSFSTFSPTFRNNATRNINFNPVIDFNRGASNHLKGKGGFWTNDYYIVLQTNTLFDKTTSNSQYAISGKYTKDAMGQDGTGLGLGRISSRFNADALVSHLMSTYAQTGNPGMFSYGRSYAPSTTSNMGTDVMIINVKSNTSVTPPTSEIYINGKRVDNHTGTVGTTGTGLPLYHTDFANLIYNLGVGQFTLNGFSLNSYLDGKMSEVFSYSSPKTGLDHQRILSYLAIKNGVSLKASGSGLALTNNQSDMDYVDSNGTVIWNATTHAAYNYDVAAIGRDDATQLNQKQSKSSNPTNLLSVGLGDLFATNSANTNSFSINRNFLVWGDNGANMNAASTPITLNLGPTTVTTLTDVCNRNWKFIEIGGDMPEVKVSIPTSALVNLPALVGNDAYVMIVANDAAFTTGLETVFLTTNGSNQECVYDFDGTKFVAFGVAHETIQSRHVTFDGTDNIIRVGNTNNLTGPYTIMAWVRTTGSNDLNNDKTIVSKMSATAGYKLVVRNNNRIQFQYRVGGTTVFLNSNATLPLNEWHNIVVTYDGTTTRLYVDGVNDNNNALLGAAANTGIFSIGADYQSKTSVVNYFRGDIDEVRIWNRALSENEFRFVMNQEIEQHGSVTRGKILPATLTRNDISALNWNNLIAYYSMNSYIGTHLNDDSLNNNRGSLVVPNQFEIRDQTAPMPYVTTANGLWSDNAIWTNGSVQSVPYSLSIVNGTTPIDWNIVQTTHNITSTGNKTVLSLLNNSNTITCNNDSRLTVTHYLRLNGKIDLNGESQLIQTLNSDLDPTSSGSIDRDQDGTAIRFDYNYWSSPVGAINNTTNNNSFTVGGVLRDGTNPSNPQNITWTNGINGAATTPITLSNFWIYKFQNTSNNYANWIQVRHTGTLLAGQGFTMKGPGVGSSSQNYTFIGKPNNGQITFSLGANMLNLTGNPYASALDANQFITDNLSRITGTLYLWEHWGGGSHNLGAYQGGYASYNLTGGVSALSHPMVNQTGSGTKTPEQYIPVSQGFFIIGNSTGGTVTFNNNQRTFQKESGGNSIFLRNANATDDTAQGEAHFNNNANDPQTGGNYAKLRFTFTSANGFRRELLLGFMNELATSQVDPGYDAVHIDNQQNDMYFKKGSTNLVIMGEGFFEPSAIYPITVKNSVAGPVKIRLASTENFDANQNVYVFDNIANTYHSIKNQDFEVVLPAGTIENRFNIVFSNEGEPGAALNNQDFTIEGLDAFFANQTNAISISNTDNVIKEVTLYNILGQNINTWNYDGDTLPQFDIPVGNLSSGTYIFNVVTDNGTLSKKFIIK